jgi:hypothetical protein
MVKKISDYTTTTKIAKFLLAFVKFPGKTGEWAVFLLKAFYFKRLHD